MDFRIEKTGNRLSISFPSQAVYWERRVSELVKDRVILDLKGARRMLSFYGDPVVYTVYDLWQFLDKYKRIYSSTRLKAAITLLKYGLFSVSREGELFLTYGHTHVEPRGEFYKVLEGSCYLLLTHAKTKKSYLVDMRRGEGFFIHPSYMHRLIVKTSDTAVLGFVPEDAGHNYAVVKGKGFPVHLFLSKGWFEIKPNPKYKVHAVEEIRARKFGMIKSEELAKILLYPERYKRFYLL